MLGYQKSKCSSSWPPIITFICIVNIQTFIGHIHTNTQNTNTNKYQSSSGDEIPERDVTYDDTSRHVRVSHRLGYMITHLPLNYETPVILRNIFWSNAYIPNGRRFTKSALRVLLLSTLRVSSIKYYLVLLARFIQETQLTQRDREHNVS